MKASFNFNACRRFGLLIVLTIEIAGAVLPSVTPSANATDKKDEAGSIQIKADSLVAYNEASYAEFSGNVTAVQGTTQITANKLRIYYSKAPDGKGRKETGEESVKKVTASGKVVIQSENRTAYTSEAEYTPSTKVVILSGPDSKVVSGNNFVSGEKITFFIKEDRVSVERGKEKQVEAVFYSDELDKKP